MITSGCSGWDPNEAEYAIADSMLGEWTAMGNPCVGENADRTFGGQSTHVITVDPENDKYIAMFDKWNKQFQIYLVTCSISFGRQYYDRMERQMVFKRLVIETFEKSIIDRCKTFS